MRILTVRQPWAWAIIHGGKNVENRTRNIAGAYRGPVAIHVAQQADKDVATLLDTNRVLAAAVERAGVLPEPSYGEIIGVVDLVDVHASADRWGSLCGGLDDTYRDHLCSPWAMEDHFHLVLANPRPFAEPIRATGKLGLWGPDADLLAQIEAQMGGEA